MQMFHLESVLLVLFNHIHESYSLLWTRIQQERNDVTVDPGETK
jgi:hypothetical protein